MNKKIFTVFVNYNFGDKITKAVKSVLKFKSVSGVIVIDNASADKSIAPVKKIKSPKKKLVVIENAKNEGFDKAVNVAISKALSLGATHVIPLDADLDFSVDFIESLYNTGADFVVPVLKFKRDGKWVYDYGGRVNWSLGRTTHLEFDHPLKPEEAAISTSDRYSKNWIDFVSGGCSLIKREVFEKVGLFDEDYFLYFGDAEFAIRARNAGFKVVVDPKTFMWHEFQEHKVTWSRFKIKTTLAANLTFINKVVPEEERPIAWGYWLILWCKVHWNYYRAMKEWL